VEDDVVLPDYFKDMHTSVTVLKMAEHDMRNLANISRAIAAKEKALKVYMFEFGKGRVLFELNIDEFFNKDVMMLAWMAVDSTANGNLSCGGFEENLSLTSGVFFESCTASSQSNDSAHGCEHGLSGKMSDEKYGAWATKDETESIGAFMDINFKSMVFPTKLMFKQRDLAANMVQTFTVF